jgi:thymidylate synthase (FAD)
MKILKNAGSFEILTPITELKNQLEIIKQSGMVCYQSESKKSTTEFISMLIDNKHESVLEHSNMSVQFNNLSRGFTHEQVRHRLTAISQESTRYVDYAKVGADVDLDKFQLHCVVPPHKNEYDLVTLEDGRQVSMVTMFLEIEKFYRALRKAGWKAEDARQILPIGLKSQIVISANFREWRHIFTMRTSKAAHWEIRGIMCKLLEYVQPYLSPVFDDFKRKETPDLIYYEKEKL